MRHAGTILGFSSLIGCLGLLAQTPPQNAATRLPITDSDDRIFVRVTDGPSPLHARTSRIIEDRQGFLWFGTRDGLDRFDGYRFRHFRPNSGSPNSLSGAFVNDVFQDRDGKIWVGAIDFLDSYDPVTEAFSHYHSAPANFQGVVKQISQDRAGMIWLATSRGLARLNPQNGEMVRFPHDPNDPATLSSPFLRFTLEGRDGTFWVASNVALDIFDRGTGRVTAHFPLVNPFKAKGMPNESVALLEDHAGVIWVASARDGLAFVDRQRGRLNFLGLAVGSEDEPGACALLEDHDGTLWVGTKGGGLLQLDRDRKRFVRYRNDPDDAGSLTSDWVISLFADREGEIWAGTASGGVVRFANNPLPFRRYQHKRQRDSSLGTENVFSAHEDSHGILWAGGQGALNRIDPKTGPYTLHPLSPNVEIASIVEDRSGWLWVGTRGDGVIHFNPSTGESKIYHHVDTNPTSIGDNDVRTLLVDSRGTLWAGTGRDLYTFNPEIDRFQVHQAGLQGADEVNAIAVDAAGILWIGTCYTGLHRLDPVSGTFTIFGRSSGVDMAHTDCITSVLVDSSGIVWTGTWNGLNRLDPRTGSFRAYVERDGLPSNVINGIVEDSRHDLWVSTANGLSHFDPRANTFHNYSRSDGVLDDLTGAWKGRSGQLFFGSYGGLTVLAPEKLVERSYDPPVILTNFQLSDQAVPIGGGSPLKQSISFSKSLTLSHQQNNLSFEFAALSYAAPERTRYQYRLEKLEGSWNEVDSTERFAHYRMLAPGTYIFRVQSRVIPGDWSKNGAEVRITILPPWWSTWWFRLLDALAIGCLAWSGYQWRIQQLRRQQKELRDIVETIPAMAWAALPDGSHAFVNRVCREYTGLSAVEPVDSAWKNAAHPEDAAKYIDKWRKSITTGEPFEHEMRLRRAADGEYRWFLLRAVPLRDKRGNILKWFGITADIEDRKRTEEERERLRQMEADLAHINRVNTMGELAASLAHELRQPIAAAATNARTCLRWLKRDQPHIEEACQTASRIVSDVTRASDIISRVRSLYKKSDPERELVDVEDLIIETTALLGSEAARYRVSARTDCAARLPKVLGDRVQLQQVLMNLILNSIQAMKDVNRNRELSISAQRAERGQLLISISDTGVGLPTGDPDQIFAPFFTTKLEGTGMGLAIARSIVESHSGRLWATPNDGSGATLHLTLPTNESQGDLLNLA